jgi:hypothetical protein
MRRALRSSILGILVFLLAACASTGDGGTGGSSGSGASSGYNTKFPMPAAVSNFTETGTDSINFQTKTNLTDTIAFYRAAFRGEGLTERTINTDITDTTFSMVFDGDPSGKAIVVQGVDLGNGSTNVNVRYEDV